MHHDKEHPNNSLHFSADLLGQQDFVPRIPSSVLTSGLATIRAPTPTPSPIRVSLDSETDNDGHAVTGTLFVWGLGKNGCFEKCGFEKFPKIFAPLAERRIVSVTCSDAAAFAVEGNLIVCSY